MPYENFKGNAGRPKGSPNKIGDDIREILREQTTEALSQIATKLAAIKNPEKYIEALSRIFPYIVPQLKSIELEGEINTKVSFIKVEFEKPNDELSSISND